MKHLLLPHNVSIKKPLKVTDSGTGIGSLNYATPVSTRTVICKVDFNTANVQMVVAGKMIDRYGVLFTRDRVVETDDVFTWNNVVYLIATVAEKYSHDGQFHHNECGFVRDIR